MAMPDIGTMADMVAERAAAAMSRSGSLALNDTLSGLESRISAMLNEMPHDREVGDLNGMQAGISEVNERLRRLEQSLMARAAARALPHCAADDGHRRDHRRRRAEHAASARYHAAQSRR